MDAHTAQDRLLELLAELRHGGTRDGSEVFDPLTGLYIGLTCSRRAGPHDGDGEAAPLDSALEELVLAVRAGVAQGRSTSSVD